MSNQGSEAVPLLEVSPSPLDIGITYKNCLLEGSFQVARAGKVFRVQVLNRVFQSADAADADQAPEVLRVPGVDTRLVETRAASLTLSEPRKVSAMADCWQWQFKITAREPGRYLSTIQIETDQGRACQQVSFHVPQRPASGESVLFCRSPYCAAYSYQTLLNLRLAAQALGLRLSATESVPQDLSPYAVILLSGQGLSSLTGASRNHLISYLAAGGRLIVLADHYYNDTIMWSNHLTEKFGIHILGREYREVLCSGASIVRHELTRAVKKLWWFRPSPLQVSQAAQLLVVNPAQSTEGFVACSGPTRNLLVVGVSGIDRLLTVGWPFHNGQLFANLLRHKVRASPSVPG
jgi:hypothetical protein